MNLLASFSTLKSQVPAELQSQRQRGADYFRVHGLPSRHVEEWKYTSLKTLQEDGFESSLLAFDERPSHDSFAALAKDLEGPFDLAVFINGVLDRTLSNVEDWPAEIQWSTNVAAKEEFQDSFEALNEAYLGQGFSLKIPAEVSLKKPFRLHFHVSSARALMVNPRVKIEIGERSKVEMIESYSSEEGQRHFTNAQTEVHLGANAQLVHLRLQEESLSSFQIGRTRFFQKKNSSLTSLVFSSGGALSRHELDLPITASEISAKILGVTASTGIQHMDNTTLIDHRVGGASTEQIYKSLLDGESRVVFNGRVFIRPGAQKASSQQLNNNLLLTSKAEADSQPQLMIEADDVKATHGSTVGHLNQEELFYLQSRGLSRSVAIPLLAFGFLSEVLEVIENEELKKWLGARLRKAFMRLKTEGL